MQRASNLFGLLALLWSARYVGTVDNSLMYFVPSLGVIECRLLVTSQWDHVAVRAGIHIAGSFFEGFWIQYQHVIFKKQYMFLSTDRVRYFIPAISISSSDCANISVSSLIK